MDLRQIWSHFGEKIVEEEEKRKREKKRRGRGRREEEEGGTKIKGMELLNLSMDLWFCMVIILSKPRVC